MHDRARHIKAKNPEMPESEAFAIATQQSHALGKSPQGYGTSEGRSKAKAKYDTPGDDKKTADPGGIGKEASVTLLAPFTDSFCDELEKIAIAVPQSMAMATQSPLGAVKTTVPKDTLKKSTTYSKVNSSPTVSPIAQHQPVLDAPPVRT